MSASSQRRTRLSACSSVKVPYPLAYSLIQRRSGVIDLSEFHGVLLVHGPELGCLAVRKCEICGNELLLDRADVLAQQRHLLIQKGVSASGSRSARLRSCILGRDSWRSGYTGSKKCKHSKR